MKKILIPLLLFCMLLLFSSNIINAQDTTYTLYKVKTGETLTGIAKKYNTNVADMMRLNKWRTDSKLMVGDTIKIPNTGKSKITARIDTSEKKFSVTVVKNQSNATKYTVAKGDNLYQISQRFKVSIDELKAWNNITDNSVKAGQVLIVGKGAINLPVSKNVNADTGRISENVKNEPESKPEENIPPASELPEEKKDAEVEKAIAEKSPAINNDLSGDRGFFSQQFEKDVSGKTEESISGTAKIFKTASGWSDKKYYILMNDMPPGSIVKITAANGKVIHAKVLGSMENRKEDTDIDFRISDAAAAALQITNQKFALIISYYK